MPSGRITAPRLLVLPAPPVSEISQAFSRKPSVQIGNSQSDLPNPTDPLSHEKAGYTPNAILDALCDSGWAGVLHHDIPHAVLVAASVGSPLPTPQDLGIKTPPGYGFHDHNGRKLKEPRKRGGYFAKLRAKEPI